MKQSVQKVANRYLAKQATQGRVAMNLAPSSGENDTIRWHCYRDQIEVKDLRNAGKRGQMVDIVTLYDLDYSLTDEAEEAVARLIHQLPRMSIQDVAEKFQEIVFMSERRAQISRNQTKGVNVAPAGFKPFEIHGKDVYVSAEWDSFRVKNNADQFNEPTCIPAIRGGKASIPVFYRWVRDNQRQIPNMTYREVLDAMQKNGIDYHSYCAMD